jgi:hypothetical protein
LSYRRCHDWKGIALMLLIVVALACIWTFQGCVASGQIAAEDIHPALHLVCDRHDAYVHADTTLTSIQSQTYLRSSELLRLIVDEAAEGER